MFIQPITFSSYLTLVRNAINLHLFLSFTVIGLAYFLSLDVGMSIWLFHLLTRISLVNKLFTYTTFTRIFRRYHEPDTRLKHIAIEQDKT